MKRTIILLTVLGLAACSSQPPAPPPPRIPRVTIDMSRKDPSLLAEYLPICRKIATDGTQTPAEYTRCRLIYADESLRQTDAQISADAKRIPNF
jgi:hypothetical protein